MRNEEIFRLYQGGGITLKAVGKRYGLTGSHIKNIIIQQQRKKENDVNPPLFYGLSVRAVNSLKNYDIESIDDARAAFLSGGLDNIPNLGKKSIEEIRIFLGIEPSEPRTGPRCKTCPNCGYSLG